MNTKGGKRRAARREGRRDKRATKREKVLSQRKENYSLGGSQEEEQRLYDESRANTAQSRQEAMFDRNSLRNQVYDAQQRVGGADRDYRQDRSASGIRDAESRDSIQGIGKGASNASTVLGQAGNAAKGEYTSGASAANAERNRALNTNQLTGTAENVLAQRAAQVGGIQGMGAAGENILAQRQAAVNAAPSIGSLTESAIGQNTANANAQLSRGLQENVRRAQGLAASQGEGGALAMQQALASAGASAGDITAQKNLALMDQSAALRQQAAMQQRGETLSDADLAMQTRLGGAQTDQERALAEAGYSSDARMNAAQQERNAALTVGGANADALAQAAQQRAAAGMTTAGGQAELAMQSGLATNAARQAEANRALQTQATSGQLANATAGQAANLTGQAAELSAGAAKADQTYGGNLLTGKYTAQTERDVNTNNTTAEKIFGR